MFKVNKETAETKQPKYFHGGINEPVELLGIFREPIKQDGTGDIATVAKFTNGETEFRHIFFDINPQKIAENIEKYAPKHNRNVKTKGYVKDEPITVEQAIEMAEEDYSTRIYNILKPYADEGEEIVLDPKTYDDLVLQANRFLRNRHLGKQMRLKLTYPGKSTYLSLPKFDFLEPVTVNPSKLKIEDYEKITKPQAAQNPQGHPADNTGGGNTNVSDADDLPF
jgi:hypothetical protein